MNVRPVDPTSPDARRLIALSDEGMSALYPAGSNHFESPEALALPNVRFVGIHAGGKLIACGAVKLLDDDGHYGEIKRVFVLPEHRGNGLARAIMATLEAAQIREGYRLARLETGIAQPEALGLYRALGYVERAPFGAYRPDPLSVFMEKPLDGGNPWPASAPAHGPDPVDGLRLAMMQRREAQLLARLGFRAFGVIDGLQLLMLVCGVVILANAGNARSRLHFLVLGWALVIQGIALWLAARSMAKSELRQLQQKISAVVQGRDGKIIVEAAAAAQSLLLRKK